MIEEKFMNLDEVLGDIPENLSQYELAIYILN